MARLARAVAPGWWAGGRSWGSSSIGWSGRCCPGNAAQGLSADRMTDDVRRTTHGRERDGELGTRNSELGTRNEKAGTRNTELGARR